jgi:autotransporter family porin
MAANPLNQRFSRKSLLLLIVLLAVLLQSCNPKLPGISAILQPGGGKQPVVLYEDQLTDPWVDWSWDSQRNLEDKSISDTGCSSISVTIDKAWGGLYLHSDQPQRASGYSHLQFFINGGDSGNQTLKFYVNKDEKQAFQFTIPPKVWTQVSVPLSRFGSPASISDLYWQDASGEAQSKFYLDAITLVDFSAPATIAQAPACKAQASVPPAETPALAATDMPETPANGTPVNSTAVEKIIYDDTLAVGWDDWSWDVDRNLINADPVQSGPTSIAVEITAAWGALYFHASDPVSTAGFTQLVFWIHGGKEGGQQINLVVNGNKEKVYSLTPKADKWEKITVPLSAVGSPDTLIDLFWQDGAGDRQSVFYLDSVQLVGGNVDDAQAHEAETSTPVSAGKKFVTLPPGAKLPSDAECAAAVRKTPENKGDNQKANATLGNQRLSSDFFGSSNDSRAATEIAPRVTGNFTGTTDEILQWAACKWGIDEDMVRAQAAVESWWHQDTKGDWTTDASRCAPDHGLGVDGKDGQCPESFGVLQTRYPYEQSAWPGISESTAFNADTAYAIWRSCYEGYDWWLNSADRGKEYQAGDAWGCMGRWFSGRWYTDDANTYIGKVKDYFNSRIWETTSFQEP